MVCNLRLAAPKALAAVLIVIVGAALALLPLKWAVLLLAGAVVLMAVLLWPRAALCLLAFAVPFGSISEFRLGPVSIGAAELLIALLFASWLARMISARRVVIAQPRLLLPLLLFLGAISLSTLVTSSLQLSLKEIVKWLEVLVIYLFMAGEVNDRWGKWVIASLLAAGSAEALVGVYQFMLQVGPEGFVLFGRFMRAHGHFAQPNPFAGYLGLTLPLAYALAFEGLQVWRDKLWPAQARLPEVLTRMTPYLAYAGSFAILSVAMMMSWSRGAWVGLAAALVVITVVRSRTALLAALAVALVVSYLLLIGGAQYLPQSLVQRFSDFLPYLGGVDPTRVDVTDANWAVIERMAHWLAAVGMLSDHPWLGVGIGNYAVAYPQYALGRWRDPLGHAHNYYLNIAAEAGIIGLVAYLMLFAACLVHALRVIRRAASTRNVATSSRYRRGRPSPSLSSEGPRCAQGVDQEVAAAPGFSSTNMSAHHRVAEGQRRYWRAAALGALGVLVHLCVHSLFDNLFVHNMNVQLGLVLGLVAVAQKTVDVEHTHRD
jgi:putative inorganic carbon (HCO3(-)) transporter